jgi:hypothetical protein
MRSLWIVVAAVALGVGALVWVLRGGDEGDPGVGPAPADAAVQTPATTRPTGPRPPSPRPVLGAPVSGDAGRIRRPAPGLEATGPGLSDGGVASVDDALRDWARRKRAENAERLVEARAEIRTRVTARVTEEVDGAIDRLTRELASARSAGDLARSQALDSRLADLRRNRDTLIEERVDAIVAE